MQYPKKVTLLKGNIDYDLKNITIDDAETLSSQIDYDTLNSIGAAIEQAKMNIEKKVYIAKIHPYKISTVTKKEGVFYRTTYKIDSKVKQKLAKTETELINWLYDFYNSPESYASGNRLCDFYKLWKIERRHDVDVKHISILTYEDDVRAWETIWSKSELATLPITAINTGRIMKVAKSITQDGIITKKAFRRILNPIRQIFDYAIDYGYVDSNPAKSLPLSRLHYKNNPDNYDDVYTREDRDKLLNYLCSLPEQDVYSLAVQLVACLGKRIGEIRALHWDDYDKENMCLKISRQIARTLGPEGKKIYAEKPLKKNGKVHKIPIVEFASNVIEQLRAINGEKKYILNSNGELPIDTAHFNEHLKQYCKACGIQYHSSHKFRFYGVSEAYSLGINENKIVSYANHASKEMTRHYDRSTSNMMSRDEAESIFGFTHINSHAI